MVIVLSLVRLLLCLTLLALQACQSNHLTTVEQASQMQKHQEAASYNTQLGLAYLKQGNRPRAKRKLLTALDLAPESADVNAAMAYYLEKTGDRSKAQVYYKKALALAPNSGVQLNNYGAFLCRLGQYKEAEDYFLKAVNDISYVNTAAAYENAGLCSLAESNYAKAEQYFAKALEQDPRRRQALYELVAMTLGQKQADQALNSNNLYRSKK